MTKIKLTESEFKSLIQETVKRALNEQKIVINEKFRQQLYDKNDMEEILINYLSNAIELVGEDPDTEAEGGYGWDHNYIVNDFDNETIIQARKDIRWFLIKADNLLRQINKKFDSKLENDQVAWGLVYSRNLGDPSFWNVFVQGGDKKNQSEDQVVANGLTKIALELGYITIIKTNEGKLKIIKR